MFDYPKVWLLFNCAFFVKNISKITVHGCFLNKNWKITTVSKRTVKEQFKLFKREQEQILSVHRKEQIFPSLLYDV